MKTTHIILFYLLVPFSYSSAHSLQEEMIRNEKLKKPILIERAYLHSKFSKYKECVEIKKNLKVAQNLSREEKLELKKKELVLCKN